MIAANDVLQKTKRGLLRSSSGSVTYSASHRLKAELDVKVLAEFLGDSPPGRSVFWTPQRLEMLFKERTGRVGVWNHYEIGIAAFLALFPKTFELFGGSQYVQLRQKILTVVLDNIEEAMVNLAKASKDSASVTMRNGMPLIVPDMGPHRMKVAYQESLAMANSQLRRS